jgi:hypothetical protein
MSGSITTANGVDWFAAGWVFRNILDRTAEVLSKQGNQTLADLISNEEGVVRVVDMLELADLSQEDQAMFFSALKISYQQYEEEGAKDWNRPDFFPGFMERFQELLAIVSTEASKGSGA